VALLSKKSVSIVWPEQAPLKSFAELYVILIEVYLSLISYQVKGKSLSGENGSGFGTPL